MNWQKVHLVALGLTFSAASLPILGHYFAPTAMPVFMAAAGVAWFCGGLLAAVSPSTLDPKPIAPPKDGGAP